MSTLTREQAIRYILGMIKHPRVVLSEPMFNHAQEVAIEYKITALELLKAAKEWSREA